MQTILPRLSTCTSVVLIGVICLPFLPALTGGEPRPLAGLKQAHPRLLLTSEDEARIVQLARSEPLLAKLIQANHASAVSMLSRSRVRYEIPDGKRLLAQSRKCVERVTTMALAYRLSGEKRFAESAIREMETAAAFVDWNPSHFLDTAEMTAALAIGYDWLFDEMTAEERKTIREAMIAKGLQPGLKVYRSGGWWTKSDNNWNQVCNGGMVLGALAIAETERELATEVMRFAIKSIPLALTVYRPSGAYPEGPGYWHYGTEYTCVTLAALRTALGHDFGLGDAPGFDQTGFFRIYTIGPTDLYFNYADAHEKSSLAASMFFLARIHNRPAYAWWHRQRVQNRLSGGRVSRHRFFAMEVVWYDPRGEQPTADELPLDKLFRSRQDVVALRGAWGDKRAVYVGFKAGDNRTNHGHLDIGSFVLDADGVRWAVDLGSDNYNMPGYFGKQRWQYYRLTNVSHNTLVIGRKTQDPRAVCRVIGFQSTPQRAEATVDMTDAYAGEARRVTRTIALVDRREVRVRDQVQGARGAIRWAMVTRAKIDLKGGSARLSQSGKQLRATIVQPKGARFEVISTKPPTELENPNRGTRMLAVVIDKPRKEQVIEIVLRPQ